MKLFFYVVLLSSIFYANALCSNPSILENIPSPAHQQQEATLSLKIPKIPWHLTNNFLEYLKKIFYITFFVETGTAGGETAFVASSVFDEVYTVELSEELFAAAKNKFKTQNNMHFYQGNSPLFLQTIIPQVQGKILFWLDAHYSGGKTARGDKDTPIFEELDAIKNSNCHDAIIMIDDLRFFYAKNGSYPPFEELIKHIVSINPTYQIVAMGDILLAYPAKYNITVSPVLYACTVSRLYYQNKQISLDIKATESIIARAEGEEFDAIEWLYNYFGGDEHHGFNNHAYTRWHNLIYGGLNNQGR